VKTSLAIFFALVIAGLAACGSSGSNTPIIIIPTATPTATATATPTASPTPTPLPAPTLPQKSGAGSVNRAFPVL
jgi:hypothetical protein